MSSHMPCKQAVGSGAIDPGELFEIVALASEPLRNVRPETFVTEREAKPAAKQARNDPFLFPEHSGSKMVRCLAL